MQGIKLELFIFDTFPLAASTALLEVRRVEEFAPVKNAPGSATDSPDTAKAAIMALHKRCGAVRVGNGRCWPGVVRLRASGSQYVRPQWCPRA